MPDKATTAPDSSGRPAWLSEGVAVAGISAVGYLAAYAYQLGFCLPFSIPPSLIEVGLSDVLPMALVTAMVFFGFIVWAAACTDWTNRGKPWRQHALIYVLTLPWLIPATVLFPPLRPVLLLLYTLLVGYTVPFVGYLVFRRGAKRDRIPTVLDRVDPVTNYVLVGVVCFVLFATSAGMATARSRSMFLVSEGYVVLQVYGDRAIMTPIGSACARDRDDTSPLKRQLRVVDLSNAPVNMELRDLGDAPPCTINPGADLPWPLHWMWYSQPRVLPQAVAGPEDPSHRPL